jgi:hypothetical protein
MLASIPYGYVLLVLLAAAIFLLLIFLSRRRLKTRSLRCASLGSESAIEEHQFYTEYLMPLLVFERDYPAFTAILALVLREFPISRFAVKEEFRSALAYLRAATFNGGDRNRVPIVMSVVVNAFLSDPDVEYALRLELPQLLNKFLREIAADAK